MRKLHNMKFNFQQESITTHNIAKTYRYIEYEMHMHFLFDTRVNFSGFILFSIFRHRLVDFCFYAKFGNMYCHQETKIF